MARKKIFTWIAPLAIIALSFGAAATASAAPSKAPSQAKGTLVIGNISNATGSGLPSTGAFQTLNAWAKDVNSRGGINGYKVVVKTADDKADPAKASEAIKTLLDAGAIAIVGQYAGGTSSVWLPIADDAKVPVIGGGCYGVDQVGDQNFFCVTTTAILDGLYAQAKLVADQGGKKFGITYDSAQPQAAAAAPLMKGASTKYGLQFTDGLGVSNTQPDYTATCVTFKQSGTTDVGIEGAPQLPNLARDCARQGYTPKWTSGDGQISLNSWLKDPNIKEAIAAIYSFPYLDTSTPATKRFNSVMKKYAPDVLKSDYKQPATTTWTAAIAFEKAAAKLTSPNPTAADVTAALNAFNGETLDGLAPNPLTFTAGQEHPHNSCWFTLVLKNHKLTAPKGMKTTCTQA
ncbi:MAG: branched-chain amino acid transport system substrate-binding protein [Actinomycetota bacterium]|nr:branched-chain amino acid transport system substrate-binding protein [Actinomycetota bacterium]